ncbi:MAG TPA: hypothetical protein VH391_07410 [Solirubrobacterales bacterium]|jgi:hypothetical protein
MRKTAIVIAALVAGLIAGGATLAGAAPKAKHHGGRTLKVYAATAPNGIRPIPVDPGKFGLGDRVALNDILRTHKGGKQIGRDGGACVTVRVIDAATATGVLECEVTFSLPGGDIATQALNTLDKGAFSGVQKGAITGGTGKYRGATGELSLRFLSPDEVNATFHLAR